MFKFLGSYTFLTQTSRSTKAQLFIVGGAGGSDVVIPCNSTSLTLNVVYFQKATFFDLLSVGKKKERPDH